MPRSPPAGSCGTKEDARLNETRMTTASGGRPNAARSSAAGSGGTMPSGGRTTRTRPGNRGSSAVAVKQLGAQISCTKRAPRRHSGGTRGSSHDQWPTTSRPHSSERGSRSKASGSSGAFTCMTNGTPTGGSASHGAGSSARASTGGGRFTAQTGSPSLRPPAASEFARSRRGRTHAKTPPRRPGRRAPGTAWRHGVAPARRSPWPRTDAGTSVE